VHVINPSIGDVDLVIFLVSNCFSIQATTVYVIISEDEKQDIYY